jgi:hypothetical protein
MMMRCFRKAQQEAISAMLLIVITVAAFGIVWQATQSWVTQQREVSFQRMRERALIEHIMFISENGEKKLAVYVFNYGDVSFIIDRLIVNGSILTTTTPSELTLAPQGSGWINATYPWLGGKVYEIKVQTRRGYEVGTFAKP